MAARSLWNGTVAFGEVIFPVKLYSVVQEHRVRFREVHLSDGGRISVLKTWENSELFATMRMATINNLYGNPLVYRFFGFDSDMSEVVLHVLLAP